MSLATSSPPPAVLTTSNNGLSNQNSKNKHATTQTAGYEQQNPTCKTDPKKARKGRTQNGHIILTPQLLHFLHRSPDKGLHVIAKITHRQIVKSAACAEKMRMLLYDIFMVTMGDNYITRQLEKRKTTHKIPHPAQTQQWRTSEVCLRNPPVTSSYTLKYSTTPTRAAPNP